jgi:predicted dienelactone hydrolase
VRVQAAIDNRPRDVQFALDYLLDGPAWDGDVVPDRNRVGVAGYSFGGWTVLAATERDQRIRAVVALAPAGGSRPKPGVVPVRLGLDWRHDVATLYLAAQNDVMTPAEGIEELFQRTPDDKRMAILERADHIHFLDHVEEEHESVRTSEWTGKLSWIPEEMRPIGELCSGEKANQFSRGLTAAHFDAALLENPDARRFIDGITRTAAPRSG